MILVINILCAPWPRDHVYQVSLRWEQNYALCAHFYPFLHLWRWFPCAECIFLLWAQWNLVHMISRSWCTQNINDKNHFQQLLFSSFCSTLWHIEKKSYLLNRMRLLQFFFVTSKIMVWRMCVAIFFKIWPLENLLWIFEIFSFFQIFSQIYKFSNNFMQSKNTSYSCSHFVLSSIFCGSTYLTSMNFFCYALPFFHHFWKIHNFFIRSHSELIFFGFRPSITMALTYWKANVNFFLLCQMYMILT